MRAVQLLEEALVVDDRHPPRARIVRRVRSAPRALRESARASARNHRDDRRALRGRREISSDGLKLQQPAELERAVERVRRRLDPRVVCVARVVDVPLVDGDALLHVEELVEHRQYLRRLLGLSLRVAEGFVLERLAHLHRDAGLLPFPHQVARDRPLPVKFPPHRRELQHARRRVVPCDDRVGRVVRPPFVEVAAPGDAGAPARVARRRLIGPRRVELDELDVALVGLPLMLQLLEQRAVDVGRVGALDGVAVRGDDGVRVVEEHRRVITLLDEPRDLRLTDALRLLDKEGRRALEVRLAALLVADEPLAHAVGELAVRRVQSRVLGLVDWIHREPRDALDVGRVAAAELERVGELRRRDVEVHRRRLHPRVVGVAGIIDVAAVHLDASVEDPFQPLPVLLAVLLRVAGEALLLEFLLHLRGHHLPRLDHPARDRPLARVRPLHRHHLQHALALHLPPPRHDRVGRVVRTPLPEQPAPAQPRAPARVARRAHLRAEVVLPDELRRARRVVPSRHALPRLRVDAVASADRLRIGRIRPAALLLRPVVLHQRGCVYSSGAYSSHSFAHGTSSSGTSKRCGYFGCGLAR